VPLSEAFEQVAAQAAELSAKAARTIIRAMRSVLEVMVLKIRVLEIMGSPLTCFRLVRLSSNEANLRAVFPANSLAVPGRPLHC
jgi:hypothetical protein